MSTTDKVKEALADMIELAGLSMDVLTGPQAADAEREIDSAKAVLRSLDAAEKFPTHFIWQMNLYDPMFDTADGDSNETCAAKALIRTYRELDGIADEMSDRDIDLTNEMYSHIESAAEVLRARDLI